MFNSSKITISAILAIIVALSFGVGFVVGERNVPATATGLDVVNQAWNSIITYYVDSANLNSANMSRSAIEGFIDAVDDPYTVYLSKPELVQFMSNLEGKFGGIGTIVTNKDGSLVIINVFPDSPAKSAGLKPGDVILEVNGESIAGLSLDVAVSKIRGPENTTVKLLILHQSETEPEVVEITRAKIEMPSVYLEMRGDIACIFLLQFTERTESELAKIIKQLKATNTKGIVLDLRSNPGGLLDTAIEVASNFIPEGVIVKTRDKNGDIETREVVSGLETTDLPMVVLVNEYSASGAEVLTGALQDHERAIIAGNTTYGKGSINMTFTLSDGSGVYITIGRWITPNDRLIEGQGIEPDIKLELIGEDELQWAIDYLTENLLK